MTAPATGARGGRTATVSTRDNIVRLLRRYAALYGDDFTAAAFSPSTAKWRDERHLIERYQQGDPETGEAWPSLNAIKRPFGGSFNAAREAAGLEPNRPGPAKRRRKDGLHAPIRGESHPARIVYRDAQPDPGLVGRLERRAARAEARADRLAAKLADRQPARTVTKTKTVTRTVRVADRAAADRARAKAERQLARAAERADAARADADGARAQAREARDSAARLASRLERSEATVRDLREERRDLREQARRAGLAEDAARRDAADAAAEAERLRATTRIVVKDAPEQAAVDAALAEARDARGSARAANERAARAERDYLELAAAAKGEARRLSAAEVDELRASGPAGPALLARALSQLAAARRGGNPTLLRAALTSVASAAVSWRERIR